MLNKNYRSALINNAVAYLQKTNDSMDEKVMYLRKLTYGVYRYGRKYKYDCSLSTLHLKNNNKKQVIMRLISANPV